MPETGSLRWLNRSTVGVSLASFFSDVSHELATAVLPSVLLLLGAGPGALGLIEGSADGISAVAKLWGGIRADRVERHRPLAALGYLVTAAGTAAIGWCTGSAQILVCRIAAWIGRGSRSASRDLLMLGATPPEDQGKAFGMERAGDSLGAVVGPLLALLLVTHGGDPRHVMRGSLIPGILAFLCIAVLVRESPVPHPATPRSWQASVAGTGAPFHRFLVAVFCYGCGDFSRTLLILYATQHLADGLGGLPRGALAIALYVIHNAVSAGAAFPLGAITDRLGRRPVLLGGYAAAAATTLGFSLLEPTPGALLALFLGSGMAVACVEVAEKSTAAQLLPASVKGTGLGVLAALNGVGDWLSSAMLGALWARFPEHPGLGLGVAAGLQALGLALLAVTPAQRPAA